jgi:hypothetical protein
MLPEPGLLADDDAQFLIGENVARVTRAIADLGLRALGAFALWLPNDTEFMEPVVVSVCSAEPWMQRLASLVAAPNADELAIALDPQAWDHPEVELTNPFDPERFDAASARIFERFGDERNPSAGILNETARLVAHAPPVPAGAVLVAMATDGAAKSDEVLASIRYASPPQSVAALEARGLPGSYWDLT